MALEVSVIEAHQPLQVWQQLLAAQGRLALLINPAWGTRERRQVEAIVRSRHSLWQGAESLLAADISPAEKGLIAIATGGSSGQLRFAVHSWSTLLAAAQAATDFFGPELNGEPMRCLCTLPLHHVSGLMQAVRVLGLNPADRNALDPMSPTPLKLADWKDLEGGGWSRFEPQGYLISLVPTQLQRLLDANQADWLRRFAAILLGGAPAWPQLLAQARHLELPLAPTYGMTETAAQVATLRPSLFLAGASGVGQPLPHIQLDILNSPKPSPHCQPGQLQIRSPSLMLGYLDGPDQTARFTPLGSAFCPDDLGYLDDHGHLHILGRSSDKIITGGENVFPTEVEAAIRATGLVEDVAVVGIGDRTWGQAVTAIYVERANPGPVAGPQLQAALQAHLASYKQPKHWIRVPQLPRNAQGKLSRPALDAIAKQQGLDL
jgi:o-succinylbenzoate---CoA ligase